MEPRVNPARLEHCLSVLQLINEVLISEKPLVFLDVEATGKFHEVDRIVELYLLKTLGGKAVSHWYLVNPEIPIPQEATDIHGITTEIAQKHGQPFKDIQDGLWSILEDSIIVGYNLGAFDLPILRQEFKRNLRNYDPASLSLIDAYRIWQFIERRTLEDAYQRFLGKGMEEAHEAAGDVFSTIETLHAQLTGYNGKLPGTAEELSVFCEGRQPDFIDSEGKFKWKDGIPVCAFGNKHKGKPVKQIAAEDPGYFHWILRSEFKQDVKQLVSDFLRGKMPVKMEGQNLPTV